MKTKITTKMPRIGLRMTKSAAAVFLCFIIYHFFRQEGILFYSQLAALWCIQPQRGNMRQKAVQRTVGTMIGAAFGLAVILLDVHVILPQFAREGAEYCYICLVSLGIIAVIYTTLLVHKKDASYFSCVVFLSIVVIHIGDANPYLFVINRVMDTMVGIAMGMLVNSVHLPRRKEKDILFVSGMDDTLLSINQRPSPYSLVELNRMLEDGALFTVSTRRTPASLMEPLRDVNLRLPVIAMDGAVMYDIKRNEYLHTYVISGETVKELQHLLDRFDCNYFLNLLMDNTLVIQYQELKNEAEKDIYRQLSTSPFRNYTKLDLLPVSQCIYLMLIDKQEKINAISAALKEEGVPEKLRVSTYASQDYPGYAYIKIYNKNATRDNMLEYLKKETGTERIVTFGSIEGKYDIVIQEYDNNKVARTLKRMYEPLLWERNYNESMGGPMRKR